MTTATDSIQHQRPAALSHWSEQAWQRLSAPPRRGSYRPLDAARRQLGLLSTADDQGQCRISWLVDVEQQRVEEARFLAFGALTSHPLADAFCQRAIGQPVQEICALQPSACEADLRNDPAQPAFGDDTDIVQCTAFISDLQVRIAALAPNLTILPKPVEVERYQRKREQEWDEHDKAWLPLSLMKKLMWVQKEGDKVLRERSNREISWAVEGLHDDFQIRATFNEVPADERPTLIAFLQEGLQGRIHPNITVEEADL